MNYIELENTISEKRKIYQKVIKESHKLNLEIAQLNQQIQKIQSELFLEYLNLNEPIQFDKFKHFRGIQINIINTPKLNNGTNVWNCSFTAGDIVQIIKKNKRSVIVKCIHKNISNYTNGQRTNTTTNPESCFRVDIDDFKSHMLNDHSFYKSFTTWIKRKISLDSILE